MARDRLEIPRNRTRGLRQSVSPPSLGDDRHVAARLYDAIEPTLRPTAGSGDGEPPPPSEGIAGRRSRTGRGPVSTDDPADGLFRSGSASPRRTGGRERRPRRCMMPLPFLPTDPIVITDT